MKRLMSVLLVATVVAYAAGQELVTNGGFETGDFTGWTPSGHTNRDGVNAESALSGGFGAYFGPFHTSGGWEQILAAGAGDPLILDFWLHVDEGTPNRFEVSLGGATLFSQDNLPASAYDFYSFAIPSPVNNPVLRFQFRHDVGYFYLDEVSVVRDATPRPADLNCDGLINFFDIDPFVLALFNPAAYAAAYPNCNLSNADVNRDGAVDFFDIDQFVTRLFAPPSCPPGLTNCGGTCVNTAYDSQNCGECFHVCAVGETCSGQCLPTEPCPGCARP